MMARLFLVAFFGSLVASELLQGIGKMIFSVILIDLDPGLQVFIIFMVLLILMTLFVYFCFIRPVIPLEILERNFAAACLFRRKVQTDWPDSWEAETTKSVVFRFNGAVTRKEEIVCKVYCDEELISTTEIWSDDMQELELIFPAQRSGLYKFHLFYSGRPVRGSPWQFCVLPSPPDPPNIRLLQLSSNTLVLRSGGSHSLRLEMRDMFSNHIDVRRCHCDVTTVAVSDEAFYEIGACPLTKNVEIKFTFSNLTTGAFPVEIKYLDNVIGRLQILVLSSSSINNINSYISRMGWNSYYEATLLSLNGSSQKAKTVYIYLTDKQMIVREFFLKLIPHRLASYRVNPQVKLNIIDDVLSINQHDEADSVTKLRGDDILELAATYYTILLRRVGGSETFYEKRQFFFEQLNKYHEDLNHKHLRLAMRIDRHNIFDSSWRVTRHLLQSDWARLFEIYFDGEVGVDQGGLRREGFDLVTKYIFDPVNQIFISMEESSSSVGPNPFPPPHVKLKHFRFAGKLVGKALYESSMGDTYRLNINAQLCKSFLAQIIGVGTHFTMLEVDAPDLWRNKVNYILENDVEFLDLSFTQDEVVDGQVVNVDLISNGYKTPVTEENKKSYIVALSNYLLTTRIKSQMAAFLEGLHTLVPDNLLSLWDESELELLVCGVREYSVPDLKKHHTVVGVNMGRFSLVMTWFWQVLTHMGKEDMSRFVRFCTGSSLLPPGGWAALKPMLQISWGGGERGSLPISHTCFNMIVLPDAGNYHQLERVMLLAVREGSEGFMMT